MSKHTGSKFVEIGQVLGGIIIASPLLAAVGAACLFVNHWANKWLSGYPAWSEPYRSVAMVYCKASDLVGLLLVALDSMWRWEATPYHGFNCIISGVCCNFWLALIGLVCVVCFLFYVESLDFEKEVKSLDVHVFRAVLGVVFAPVIFIVAFGVFVYVAAVVSYAFSWLFRPE